jgi:hypothetical protein
MPARPSLEIADVMRQYGDAFRTRHGASLALAQQRTLSALARCRTATLGGHVEQCDHCRTRLISYNSCRNRHYPKCQAGRGALWVEREARSLLPVEYHHVVFTLPHELAPLALQNPALVYGLLFRAVAETLQKTGAALAAARGRCAKCGRPRFLNTGRSMTEGYRWTRRDSGCRMT